MWESNLVFSHGLVVIIYLFDFILITIHLIANFINL